MISVSMFLGIPCSKCGYSKLNVFKELEDAKLIKQENQGKGKAYKIYVTDIYSKDKQEEKLHIGNGKNTSKVLEFLQQKNINKKYKKQYKNGRDYSNFDWTSLYANKF